MEICVATDLSPSADRAMQHALRWAKAHDATAVLLHVVHDPELAPAFGSDVPGDMRRATAALQAVAGASDVTCRVDVRSAEDLAGAIVEASKGCAYLFVSSQGKSAFERMRIGSVATKILRQAHVPVVCFPHVDEPA